MKMAKSYKLISAIVVFVLCVCAAIFSMNVPVMADEKVTPKATDYFTGVTDGTLTFKEDAAVASIKSGKSVLFKNKLCIDDFAIKFVLDEGINIFTLNLTYDSFYVNGNKSATGEFKKSIENKVVIKDGAAYMDGAEDAKKIINIVDGEIEIELSVDEDNFIVATVNGQELEAQTDAFYKIRKVDKAFAKIGYTPTFNGEGEKNVKLMWVDQMFHGKGSDYKQTFVLEGGKLVAADPIIGISESSFTKTIDGYKLCLRDNQIKTIKPTAYSVLGNISKVYLHTNDTKNVKVIGEERILFAAGERTFYVGDKKDADKTNVLATFTVNVQDSTIKDTSAPEYVKGDDDALEAFNAALKDAYTEDDHFVAVGESIELPSLADLVCDNLTTYDDMKVTVYYKSSTTDTSSSSMKITLNAAGDYVFYVVFTDADGNSMDKEDFIKEDGQIPEYVDEMRDFVFNFSIKDDAPLVIKEASQGKGYKGTKFTASKFTVDADGCTVEYKLYYNASSTATADAEGWIEIPKLASVTEDYDKDGYTYEDIKAIGYDGTLSFTPDKIGSYKIVCSATSKHVVGKTASASAVIRVEEKATEVDAESWIENNVWTVVFLGVGSLCLVAIIVLLFVKPKESDEE